MRESGGVRGVLWDEESLVELRFSLGGWWIQEWRQKSLESGVKKMVRFQVRWRVHSKGVVT